MPNNPFQRYGFLPVPWQELATVVEELYIAALLHAEDQWDLATGRQKAEQKAKAGEIPGNSFKNLGRWDNSWNMRKPWTFFGVQKRNLCNGCTWVPWYWGFTEHWAGEKLPKSIAFVQICGKAFKPMVLLGVSWRITPLKWFITRVVNCFELFIDGVTWAQGSHDKEVEWSHGHVLGFRTPSGWTTCSCQRWEFALHRIWFDPCIHIVIIYIYIYIYICRCKMYFLLCTMYFCIMYHVLCIMYYYVLCTSSSTAQGGGGSFRIGKL